MNRLHFVAGAGVIEIQQNWRPKHNMARQIEFDKFLIVECSAQEMMNAGGGNLCDWCYEEHERGYYIAALNHWYCPVCFANWKSTARYYPEDAAVERCNFNYYAPRLGLNVIKC